ncbi:hypothetical protein RND81_03G213300 [Saponaria officinalis]|uniref:non-specific serine/threonine protein kinase n=1 Tax=Saponaria officinalis TaxID=3572 RepID=A0AAW1MAY9_SAPOF
MTVYDASFVNSQLSKPTSIFGLRLWVVIGIFVGSIIVLLLFLISLCITSRRPNKHPSSAAAAAATPPISKEIKEIIPAAHHHRAAAAPEIQIDIGKPDHRVVFSDKAPSSGESLRSNNLNNNNHNNNNNNHNNVNYASDHSGSHYSNYSGGHNNSNNNSNNNSSNNNNGGGSTASYGGPEVSHLGWGRWYTLRELELATNCLADENVIGEGGYGIVYSGILVDNTRVAVKNLLNNRGQAEKEFKVEVEVIGRVRHKNLVRLLGYCVEGAYRMLVYEYVDNGNLDQWLHGEVGEVSPLTWDIRMNIILGTAKGLAYLHEGLEPKVVHRDIKSSNILLDRHWNPKVSDFGLAKLLNSEMSYVTTRVMGTFGYVAPEYACTGMLTEKSDVYGFGILIMELISGRTPVDYSRPPGEVNLVDWLKTMVGNRRSEEVVDPKLPEMPPSKALKRILLVALRCVDPDAQKRPKMGHVIHMLEADDLLVRHERHVVKDSSTINRDYQQQKPVEVKVDAKHLREVSTERR